MPHALWLVIDTAPSRQREELQNSGWVRHTMESAIWALLTTDSFEDAVVQAVNLGNDADTAGSVLGALAGAAYGEKAIAGAWRQALRGGWPLRSGRIRRADDVAEVADRLMHIGMA